MPKCSERSLAGVSWWHLIVLACVTRLKADMWLFLSHMPSRDRWTRENSWWERTSFRWLNSTTPDFRNFDPWIRKHKKKMEIFLPRTRTTMVGSLLDEVSGSPIYIVDYYDDDDDGDDEGSETTSATMTRLRMRMRMVMTTATMMMLTIRMTTTMTYTMMPSFF